MKVFITLSALLAVASATPLLYVASPYVIPQASSQYHSQDGIGQYAFGYNDPLSSKQETKTHDGVTRGSYSYIDANNILQTAQYTADANGFKVTASNLPKPVQAPMIPAHELPKPVQDTHEVAVAKAAHLAAIEEAKRQAGYQAAPAMLSAPIDLSKPVADTIEVQAAKAAHFAAHEEAKRRNEIPAWVPTPIGLPQPVMDTPEVAKAKAEHLLAVEQAKLGLTVVPVPGGPLPLPMPLIPGSTIPIYTTYSAAVPSTGGFTYSSSVVDHPAAPAVPLTGGFAYSSSVVDHSTAPVVQYVRLGY